MNLRVLILLACLLALGACGGGGGGHSHSGPVFPPQGAEVTVHDPFLEVTAGDGGDILLPQAWLDFSLFDGTALVEGATFKFQQCDGAGGGPGLFRSITLGAGQTVLRFAPYAPQDLANPGFCGYSESQLFDNVAGTQERKWTVTIRVPASWYSSRGYTPPASGQEWSKSYTFYLVPEEIEARGPKYHRVLGGVPETGVFWHVWDNAINDKINVNAIAHFYVANDSGIADQDWVAQVPQTHHNIIGQFGTPWYQSQLVDELTGDFLMFPDANHSSVIAVRDELGRYSRPVLLRVGNECQPLFKYTPLSYQTNGMYDIVVSPSTGGQDFLLAPVPPGYSYSNLELVVHNVTTGWSDYANFSQGVASWSPTLPGIGQIWLYEAYVEGFVQGPPGSSCAAGMLLKGERYRFRLIGQ